MNHYKVLVIDDVNEDISNCDPVEVQFNNNDVTCRMMYVFLICVSCS